MQFSVHRIPQQLFAEARLRASKALSFSRILRKGVEVATQWELNCSLVALFDVLSA